MKENKETLIIALARKARALAEQESSNETEIDTGDTFFRTYKQLKKWKNVEEDSKFAILALEKEKKDGHLGLMLKRLSSLAVEKGLKTKDGMGQLSKDDILKRRLDLLEEMGYTHLAKRQQAWMHCSVEEFALF